MRSVPPVLASALLGLVGALPLLIGAWIVLRRRPHERTVGLIAAFGAGALISAISFELVEDAAAKSEALTLAVSIGLGAVVYYVGDRLLDRRAGAAQSSRARGQALMMGAALDGIPESFILGMSVAAGLGFEVSFLVAVVVSNLPEGMASTAELLSDPEMTKPRILRMWLIVVAVCAASAALGGVSATLSASTGAVAEAFAAGALLTMLIDDLVPEAREQGGIAAGLVATLGFGVAFALHQLGA